MRKFTVLFILTLFVLSFATDSIFASAQLGQFPVFPSFQSINVLPLSVQTQEEDVEATVAKVFDYDTNTLTDDSGVESAEDLESIILEVPTEAKVEKVQEKVQETKTESKKNVEEILDESQAQQLLTQREPSVLEEERLVDEVNAAEAKQQKNDPKQCLDFCLKTGSDNNFCQKHCASQ